MYTYRYCSIEPGEKEVRNPLIVSAFRRIGFSEHAGWGLRDVFRSWRDLGYLPPEITNDKSNKTFELILKQEILLSEDQIAFQKTIGVHLSQDEAAVFAYACKKLTGIHLTDIRSVINEPVSTCVKVANQLVNQVLLVRISENSFDLAPVMKQRFIDKAHDKAHDEAHDKLNETEMKILQACKTAMSTPELLKILGYKSRTGNYKNALTSLLEAELIEMTIPESPRSKSQKYIISAKGIDLMKQWENMSD